MCRRARKISNRRTSLVRVIDGVALCSTGALDEGGVGDGFIGGAVVKASSANTAFVKHNTKRRTAVVGTSITIMSC